MEDYYKKKELMKRIADLLVEEQGRLHLTNEEMARKLDISCRTYERLTGSSEYGFKSETLVRILANTEITYDDIFEGIYKSKYGKKEI